VASSPHSTSSQRCFFLLSPELVRGWYRTFGKEGIRRTAERGCCSSDPEVRATASGRAVVQEAAACSHRVASGSERDECPKAGQGAQTRKGGHGHSGVCLHQLYTESGLNKESGLQFESYATWFAVDLNVNSEASSQSGIVGAPMDNLQEFAFHT
jgi:hypothetical protein